MASELPKRSQRYPPPLVIEAAGPHLQSMIILHGRGSNAADFAHPLLQTRLPDGRTFQDAFPCTKFIFPTASFRRATIYKRIRITQWFDNVPPDHLLQRPELQIDGLRESSQFVHGLLKQEAELVGANNVIVGGLSQGSATTLVSLMLWDGPPLRAAFGMSGWLPFRELLSSADGDDRVQADDFFEPAETGSVKFTGEDGTPYDTAVRKLRQELDMELGTTTNQSALETPIFLGHGVEDEKVSVGLGRSAFESLRALGCVISWHEYEGLGHWYHSIELGELVDFIQGHQ